MSQDNACPFYVPGLDRHYARAELSAKLVDDVIVVAEPINITRFGDHAMMSWIGLPPWAMATGRPSSCGTVMCGSMPSR